MNNAENLLLALIRSLFRHYSQLLRSVMCTKIPERRICYRTVTLGVDAAQAGVTITTYQ